MLKFCWEPVDPIAITEALKKKGFFKQERHTNENGTVLIKTETRALNLALRDYFITAGVDLEPPKYIFFNDRLGQILVRASQADLETVAKGIEALGARPTQVVIEMKMAEVPKTWPKR